jgi:hypothetical protein
VIRANSELQHELQLRYNNIILLSHKLLLSRLSPGHTLIQDPYIDRVGRGHGRTSLLSVTGRPQFIIVFFMLILDLILSA